jgi:P27 family predicted phage terminase small subunit
MGKRGTKPLPTAIHELNGNPSHLTNAELEQRRNNEQLAIPYEADEVPEPPNWIRKNKIACEEWERVAPMLAQMKILTKTDVVGLEAYCKCWSRYREAEEQMDQINTTFFKTPSGYVQQLPQVAIAQKYLKLCKDFMIEFGLTPSSRGRMLLPNEKDETDEMERLLRESGL